MCNMISLLQFVIFISLIAISITIETQLQFAFFNGLNVIRCSDNQVQVYQFDDHSKKVFTKILNCDDKNVFNPSYAGYLWEKLKIICSSPSNQVHEELVIKRGFDGYDGIGSLPDTYGRLGHSKELYKLSTEPGDSEEMTIIKSDDQPANNAYYNKKINPQERRIYIWFLDHPILCRIIFTGEGDNPCISGDEQEVENVQYACFYNPGDDQVPTIQEMEAEFKQIEESNDKPDNEDAYVLNLNKPNIPADDSPNSIPTNPSKNQINQGPNKNVPAAKNSPSATKKSSLLKTIGLVLGILLLLVVIGGIAFYMIQKNRFHQSVSTRNIENGGLASIGPNQSQQSLTNDQNIEIGMNDLSKKDKPDMKLQTSNANKRPRIGNNMVFNEDV